MCLERQSFENVNKWISEAKNHRGDDIMIVLVGNKLDDEENRQVSTEEGSNMAKHHGLEDIQFIETSAKTGINVKQLFKNLASNLPGMQNSNGSAS